jgi:hypothetical protein
MSKNPLSLQMNLQAFRLPWKAAMASQVGTWETRYPPSPANQRRPPTSQYDSGNDSSWHTWKTQRPKKDDRKFTYNRPHRQQKNRFSQPTGPLPGSEVRIFRGFGWRW